MTRQNHDIPKFVNHEALWMPLLFSSASKNLDKLLENGGFTAFTLRGVEGRVMIATVNVVLVLIVTIG